MDTLTADQKKKLEEAAQLISNSGIDASTLLKALQTNDAPTIITKTTLQTNDAQTIDLDDVDTTTQSNTVKTAKKSVYIKTEPGLQNPTMTTRQEQTNDTSPNKRAKFTYTSTETVNKETIDYGKCDELVQQYIKSKNRKNTLKTQYKSQIDTMVDDGKTFPSLKDDCGPMVRKSTLLNISYS